MEIFLLEGYQLKSAWEWMAWVLHKNLQVFSSRIWRQTWRQTWLNLLSLSYRKCRQWYFAQLPGITFSGYYEISRSTCSKTQHGTSGLPLAYIIFRQRVVSTGYKLHSNTSQKFPTYTKQETERGIFFTIYRDCLDEHAVRRFK